MFNKIFIGFYSYWDSAGEDMRSSHIAENTEEDAGFNNSSPLSSNRSSLAHESSINHILGTRLMVRDGFVFA